MATTAVDLPLSGALANLKTSRQAALEAKSAFDEALDALKASLAAAAESDEGHGPASIGMFYGFRAEAQPILDAPFDDEMGEMALHGIPGDA